MKVDYVTMCCPKDIRKLRDNHEFDKRVTSHEYPFHDYLVIRQRCGNDFDDVVFTAKEYRSEDYPNILDEFGLHDHPTADRMTGGVTGRHYWKHHCINHLIGLKESTADYIVFSDCDCRILDQPFEDSWITRGIELLRKYKNILMVTPSDGGDVHDKLIVKTYGTVRLHQIATQQLFLCNRTRLMSIDFNTPCNKESPVPGGIMKEYYFMLEGIMWRFMRKHGLYRAILPEAWTYKHDGW